MNSFPKWTVRYRHTRVRVPRRVGSWLFRNVTPTLWNKGLGINCQLRPYPEEDV